jgi:hypothetical protein
MKVKEFNKEEYNKLCAEFLGAVEYVPKAWYYFSRYRRHWFFPSRFEPNRFTTKMLRFDSDWNWIMELVEAIPQKVQGINISIHPNSCLITDTGVRGQLSLDASKNIVRVLDAKNSKEAVVQAIWEFLLWFNEQKQ